MSAQPNLYAPPSARVADVHSSTSEEEAIRREHIKQEASIRSVGLLYLLGGVFCALAGVGLVSIAIIGGQPNANGLMTILGVVYLAIAALSFFAGRGLRRFESWARTTSIVLAALGLLGFPIGTLINGYILYLMLSAKGKRIFEPDYPEIVAATPHIKYKTSIIVWILLGLLVAAFLAAILVPILNR